MDERKLDPVKFKADKFIGTPRGNEEFFSELYHIPIDHFYIGNLDNLLKMLGAGRIDIFLFERASTMTYVKKIAIKNVFYKNIDMLGASLAVRKDEGGSKLKRRLDDLIRKTEKLQIFKEYLEYLKMPPNGIVPLAD